MRRTLVGLSAAALAASALAFAPAVQQAAPQTDHAVTFTADGAETVDGVTMAGTNVDGGCTTDPDTTCETIHVTVEQPVADDDPDTTDVASGELVLELAPMIPGADFDFTVFESNADGTTRGTEVATSGNPPLCAQTCGPLSEVPLLVVTDCGGPDECAALTVLTTEFTSTKHYVVEVYYFIGAGSYSMDLTYDGPDAPADGTAEAGAASADGDATAPADSTDAVDVTGGFEPADDWNGGGDGQELGSALGQELEAAFIAYGEDTFTFTIDVTELPAAGGTPEATRYGWSFSYNGNAFELDGKFTNYSRGACDPTAGSCPPVRDPGVGYFALRGNCAVAEGTNVTLCEELGGVNATFDPADGTIAIPLAAELLAPEGVAACDTITGDASFIGSSVWSASSAFVTSTAFPFDDALHFVPFVVAPADETVVC